jgi:4-amino-4-deoxy-L-arabinose transferase-like glycosyltransferase
MYKDPGIRLRALNPMVNAGDDNSAAEACNLLERVTGIMQEAAVRRPLNSKLKASSTQMESWNGWSDFTTNQYAWSVLLLAVLLFLPLLGGRDLWAPVEPRYAEIVRIMFAKGEWVVPTVNGDLYTDKPILYFWLALIVSKIVGGVNEWTARLPSALAGIGFVLATYFTGRDFFGPKVGFVAGVVLATSMRVIWEARWAHIDMLFGFFFLLTIYFGARALLGKGEKREILWAYVFMGLAVLAKGLIGIVLPALLLAAFAIVRRDWRIIIDAKLQLGIPIFLLIAAPWFYLVNSATDGKWLADFIYIHHLQRYTEGIGHQQPVYYYLTTLPADFMPWTVFAVPAIAAYFPYRGLTQRPIPLFFSLCFLVVFLFFSFSDTKRDLYLLPLMPTLALLVGNYIDDLTASRLFDGALYRWLSQFCFGAVAIIGLAVPILAWVFRKEIFWISLPLALVLSIGGIVTVIFIRKRRPLKAVTTAALLMALVTVSGSIWILPYVNQFKSRRPFSLEINKIVPAAAPLYIYADTMNDFNFYTERGVISVLSSPGDLADVLRQTDNSYLLIKDRDLKRLSMSGQHEVVARDSLGSTTWDLVSLNPQRR